MTEETLYPHEIAIKWLAKNANRLESTIFFMIVGFCYFVCGFVCGLVWNHFDYKLRGLQ